MRTFGIHGRVYPDEHYVVSRTAELAGFIHRVKNGRSIVIFAPRQTGKTTFFRWALEALAANDESYFPIHLNFERYEDWPLSEFYRAFYGRIRKQVEGVLHQRGVTPAAALSRFLENVHQATQWTMLEFFEELGGLLAGQRVVLIIDEFDAIPRDAVRGFLHTLRDIYLSDRAFRCPYSVGIVGVKNIAQLDYDRAVSPFNIQDEFRLPNFTPAQVQELLAQYTAEVGQPFAPEVMGNIHKQTAGQPVLVNRLAQILTEEMDIPKTETIDMGHFAVAHRQLLRGRNTNIQHLTRNVRRNPRFERVLMQIASYDEGIDFNLDDDIISELATYGVLVEGPEETCEIANPIYLYRILRTFQPTINGLETDYYPQDTTGNGYRDYLTADGQIDMAALLDNFREFMTRAGFRILQVPDKPREYVGQHLLFAYLDNFVRQVRGVMHLEVQTGRGRIDLMVNHRGSKYIVETKIWQGEQSYRAGKAQLSAYLKLEGAVEGYYVVFAHMFNYRREPEPRVETETFNGLTIRSYVIPVVHERPSESGT